MKKLQNNFTTPEQSKRLLELGVPEWTADLYTFYTGTTTIVRKNPYERRKDFFRKTRKDGYKPIWSVGRLIEIMLLCHISDDSGIMFDKPLYEVSNCTNVEWCIRVLESSIKYGHIDFSKLEE